MAGQIIKRGDNTWLVRIYLGRDANGKREYLNKTVHGTKKDAERWRTEQLRNRDLGVVISPAMDTLNEYLDRWLPQVAQGKVTRKTFAGYQHSLQLYVRPALGNRPLSKITALEIQTAYNDMRTRGLSPRTIQYTNMILKQALKQAVVWKLIVFNPCEGVELPRQERKEMQVLSVEQVRRFMAAAKADKYGALFELAVTSGLRPSEYLALKWTDFDPVRATVSINRSLDHFPGGGWAFAENKTGRSRRTVRVHSSVVAALNAWRKAQEDDRRAAGEHWTEYGLIFTTETGGPLDRHNLARRNFRRILKAAGLPAIRLYDLRHTAATLALEAKVPVKVVSELLGHASAAMTLDVYSHVLPHMQDEAVERVENLICGEVTSDLHTTRKRHTIGTQKPN